MGPDELTFEFLREITNGFSEKRKVGEGGFGTVYKGVTKTGVDVAVKIPRDDGKDLDYRQFRNEFYNLARVKHDNIVQFLGYCYEIERTRQEYGGRIVFPEETHRALCFEYLHNGSLQNHLSDESCGLDWHTRYKIIKGTCEALKYIHMDLGESLLHLDLKPANILLDKNMVPKIADFGLSMIFGEEPTTTTQYILGTLGYQPPEYIKKGEFCKKFDIFSLGVVIMKILSGPNGYPENLRLPLDKLIHQVQSNWRKRYKDTCTSGFSVEACCAQVETCIQIALNCLEEDKQKRPDIVEIIDKLNQIETDAKEPPKKSHKTIYGSTMHNVMKLTKEHKMVTDQHQHSSSTISSRSNRKESDNIETSLDVGKEQIMGREDKKKYMASLLKNMKEKITIFPIYGIGGIGKTTFARLIYDDTNFKTYSQVWVHVSRIFDLHKIGNSIVSQLSGMESQANEVQHIKSCLTNLLSGEKQILIVLDDLWEDSPLNIEELKDMLNLGDNHSKTIVLVTTHSADIAQKICRNIEPYQIEALTDEMCWDIIKQKCGFEAIHDKEKLVGIGKEIAQKCGGVALAAQTLGFMLQSVKYDEWMRVKDSDIWNETISNDASLPNHVLASLKLSYTFSMDDCLKLCYTYCAIFPKGHKIVKNDLVYQWISLGFIMPTKMLSSLQVCENYIVRLLGLSFLQHSMLPTTYRAYGEHDAVFTMHDLVHDLAISLLGDQILDQSKQGNNGGSSCRFALLTDCSKPLESCTTSPATLSALCFLGCRLTKLHGAAFEPAESLRVLDLSECSIQKLPDSIGQLKLLGYLNAPRIRDRTVPESISKLKILRYLSLHGSCAILALPELIGEMEGLVHIDLSGCLGIEKLPESFGNLKCLEHVDFTNCNNISGVSQCLTRLTKLQHLNLSNCKNIGYLPRAMGSLTELQYLNLSDSSYLSGNNLGEAEFLGSLTKLKYLNLSSSDKQHITMLPEALGSLTELKYLNLSRNSGLKQLPESFRNLCNLVHLDLSWCSSLGDVPAALNGLTKLQYLDLFKGPSFDAMEGLQVVFSNLTELRHLNLGNCILGWNSSVGSTASEFSHPDETNDLLARICTLTNLEYLNLSWNDISSMPETLTNLKKLHTLDLSCCEILQELPASISQIDSLKFLNTEGCWMLDRSMLPQYMSSSVISPEFVLHTSGGESSSYHFQFKEGDAACLKISGLENVKSAKEAQTIKLVEKIDITRLTLEWTRDAERFVDDAEVLAELEPPYSVSELCLEGYDSVSFPSWMMRIDTYLSGLTSIQMSDLPSCCSLPPLGQLPNLKYLMIKQMDSIKRIGADLYGGTRAFPRLVELYICHMKCLEEWSTAYSSAEDGLNEPIFPCLEDVVIRHCPKLRIKPSLPQSTLNLLVNSSDEVVSSSSWRNGGHIVASAVTCLQVDCCGVPLHRWNLLNHLPCLDYLVIKNCSDLTCSSMDFFRGLISLSLTVEGRELPEWLGDLTSLRELEMSDCKGIKTLPDSIQQLTQLQVLKLGGCESIMSLPERLGDLTSLTELEIASCKGIKTLPATIQKLMGLQRLEIYECPELVQWCKSKENKMKLAHIKERVLTSDEASEELETDGVGERTRRGDPKET